MTPPMHRIMRGDSMRLLPRQPAESAQLVLADPPYGISYKSRAGQVIANDDGPYIWWMREAWRVTRPGGSLVCFTRWDVAEMFRFAIESAGFRVRSQLVWDKTVHTIGDCKTQFGAQHEIAWFAIKGRFAFPDGRPMSVLRYAGVRGANRTHPNEKPVGLMAKLIEATTRPGDLVLDPFCGTGASMVACVHTRRRGLGIELDHKYAARARQRVARERTLMCRGSGSP